MAARLGMETPPNSQPTLEFDHENPCAINSGQRVYGCSQSSTTGGTTINDVASSISAQHCDGIVTFTLILNCFIARANHICSFCDQWNVLLFFSFFPLCLPKSDLGQWLVDPY